MLEKHSFVTDLTVMFFVKVRGQCNALYVMGMESGNKRTAAFTISIQNGG